MTDVLDLETSEVYKLSEDADPSQKYILKTFSFKTKKNKRRSTAHAYLYDISSDEPYCAKHVLPARELIDWINSKSARSSGEYCPKCHEESNVNSMGTKNKTKTQVGKPKQIPSTIKHITSPMTMRNKPTT